MVRKKITDKIILEALEKSQGFTSYAAKALTEAGYKVTRQGIEWRIKKHKKLKEAFDNIVEAHLDLTESKLLQLINGVKVKKKKSDGSESVYNKPPDLGAVCFYLKCKGKGRGYIERQELSGPDGKDLTKVQVEILTTKNDNSKSSGE